MTNTDIKSMTDEQLSEFLIAGKAELEERFKRIQTRMQQQAELHGIVLGSTVPGRQRRPRKTKA